MPNANNEGTYQSADPCSVISVFIIRCLERIILVVVRLEIQDSRYKGDFCSWAVWFESCLLAQLRMHVSSWCDWFVQCSLQSFKLNWKEYEPAEHDKTSNMTCASSEASDQTGRPQNLCCPQDAFGFLATPKVPSKDSDQTGQMSKLSRVLTGCTDHFLAHLSHLSL